MKQPNRRLDFLPNKQNKYSIRKFTVGTASILVGATLMFGLSHDAQAAEEQTPSTDTTQTQSDAQKPNSDTTSQPTQETQTPAVVTPPVTTEAPASDNTAPQNPKLNSTTSQVPTTIEQAPQPAETKQAEDNITSEPTPTIEQPTDSTPISHTRKKRSLDTDASVGQEKASVNNETYNGKIIDYTGSDLVTKVENPGQTVAPDYIDFSPKFKDFDSKSYAFLANNGTVTSKKITTTNGGGIHAYLGDYIILNDNQPEAYVYINNVGTASGHKVDAWVHVTMDPPSTKFPTNIRYFFTSGRDMLSMTSQDGGGTTANIKFLSNVDKTRLEELYNKVTTGTSVNTVLDGIQAINNDLHPVSGLLNIYDLDDYDEYKAADVRKSVTFNRNEINELYISNKPSAEATANLELKDNKMIISTGQSPKGGYDDYPNRVTATFKDKSELTYSMTGRNASGTAFHVKGILLVPVQPYTVQVVNPAGNQDAKVTLTQYIPTREVYQTATLPRNIEMTAEFPQGIVANAQPTTGYFVATNNNTNKVIITDNNTALNQQDFYDKTYTLPITLKHNLTVKDIQSNSAKWKKLKTYYDGNVLNVPVKWSFDNGTKQFENLTTDHQTIPLKVSNELKKEIDKQIMAEATASVEEAKRAHAKAKATAQTIPMDQLVSKNEMDGLKNEVQTATTKKNDAQTKVNQLPERLKTNLQHELDQLTEIALPDVNDENNNGITDDQDQLIARAEALLKAAQDAEDTAKAVLTTADVNHAISPEEHNQLAALQHDFTTKKKAAETQIKAVHEKYQTPLIKKLNQLNGITVPEVNDTNNNGKPDTEDAKEQQDAALQAATALVEKAEKADQTAQTQLQQANADNLITPQEHTDLSAAKTNAETTKATADAAVKALPQALQAPLLEKLATLKGITVPDINDNNVNNIPDDQDALIEAAKLSIKEAQIAEQLAKDALTKATEDQAINQQEHDNLENLQQDFTTKKQAAKEKINAVEEKHRGELPTQLEALNGITVPAVNDTNNNGKPDTEDAKEQQAEALKKAEDLVKKAEGADQAAQTQLQQASADNLITPQEHTDLSAAKTNAETTKSTADTAVKALPQALQAPLLEKLAALKGIQVPDINDNNGNNIPDDQDALIEAAKLSIKEAQATEQTAKDALTQATADQAINQQEHDNLEKLQQDFTAKKQAAKEKINAVEEKHRGELPTQLEALKGITVPEVNDTNNNGKPDTEDAKEQQDAALQAATALVEKAEKADQAAQTQLQQTNADNLVTPQEHTNLSAAKTNAETTKATADTAVKALPQALQAPLLEKLAALKGITIPDINDKYVNNIPDDQDVFIKEAEDLLAAAKKADQSAKDALSKATEDQAINQQEHDNLENLQQDFETKKQAAKEKINAVEEKHRGELPTQLEALKGITVPEVNDTNNNGKPDTEDAKEQQDAALKDATALVEKAETADQTAQVQLQQASADNLITPQEHTDLSAAKTNAETTKATADAAVKALPEALQAPLLEKLAALKGITVPDINDKNGNNIPDDQDALIEAAKLSINEAQTAEQLAQDALSKATADQAINQQEHDNLEKLQQDFTTKKQVANEKINAIEEKYRGLLPTQLEALKGITVPEVNDTNNNGKPDEVDQAEQEAMLKVAQAALDKAKAADLAAKNKLAEVTQDKLINPEEHQDLTASQHAAVSTKAEASEQIKGLSEALRAPFETELNKLDGIVVPDINDHNSNMIPDTEDKLIQAAEAAIAKAVEADALAQTALTKATEQPAISPKTHQALKNLQQDFEQKKAAAQQALDAVDSAYQGVLPGKLQALTGIDVPEVNDKDDNGRTDDLDEKIQQDAALQAATALVEKAERANQTAQASLQTALENSLITPKEYTDLTSVKDEAASTKAAATQAVNNLPSDMQASLMDRLAKLPGITVPSVTDNNDNNIPDTEDKLIQEAKDLLKAAQAADQAAQTELAEANNDQVINQQEHDNLEHLQQDFTTKQQAAENKINEIEAKYRGELPTQLNELTGITIPDINDANGDGVSNDKEAELRKLVQKVIDTDQAAQDAFLAIQDDGLVNPDEIESLRPFKLAFYESKMIAFDAVNNLSDETPLKTELLGVLRQHPDLIVPLVNDENSNNIPDSEDLRIRFAQAALNDAKAADQAVKDLLTQVLNPSDAIDSTEQQALSAAQAEFEQKKAVANEKINAIQPAFRGDLPQQLEALTGITVPAMNDEDKNGIRDDVDQAIHRAEAAVEAAKAAYHQALTQADHIQKDGIITPKENTSLLDNIALAEAKKAEAQTKVNELLSESDQQALQAKLDALTSIEVPQANDENYNDVPDKEDHLFDEALKAYEAAKAAETKAQSVLEDVQADGVVNPDEQKQLQILQDTFKQQQVLAEEKLEAVDSQYRQDLPEKVQALTGIDIPTVNDKNHNGILDDVDTFIDKAQQVINEAQNLTQSAQSKADEVSADGLINPNELELLSHAKTLAEAKKAAAQAQINALPIAYQKDLQLQLNALKTIDIPEVNDTNSNGIEDQQDQAIHDALQALKAAQAAENVAQAGLATAQNNGVINDDEHNILVNLQKAFIAHKTMAEEKVALVNDALKDDMSKTLDALKGIEVPVVNDHNHNEADDALEQTLQDFIDAVQAAYQTTQDDLTQAKVDNLITPQEHALLIEAQNNAEKLKAQATQILQQSQIPTAVKDGLLNVLAHMQPITIPAINDQNANGTNDIQDQWLNEAEAAVKAAQAADQNAHTTFDGTVSDNLMTPEEQALLKSANNHARNLKAVAEEKVASLPSELKGNLPELLAQLEGIAIPEINDANANGTNDIQDQWFNEAEAAVKAAELANQAAQSELEKVLSDHLVQSEEQAVLKQVQEKVDTTKALAQSAIAQLPTELKEDLISQLNNIVNIEIPSVTKGQTTTSEDTNQHNSQSDKCEVEPSHTGQTHLENPEETSLHQMISKTTSSVELTSGNTVEHAATTEDINEQQEMTSQENVSSENSSRDIEQHPETTQETQTSGDESTAVSSLDEHESHAQKHVSHTLNHTTNKTTHPEQITQKALPNTGQSSSKGIFVGGIVALMGVATLVSRRRRKN